MSATLTRPATKCQPRAAQARERWEVVQLSQATADPRTLSLDELDVDITLARARAKTHITKCGRDQHGVCRCALGRDAVAEMDELLDVRLSRA